jgi:hypothetical protein
METAGRVAADTLGYIVGGTRGAFIADKMYRTYQKNKQRMAPVSKRLPSTPVSVAISNRPRSQSLRTHRRGSSASSSVFSRLAASRTATRVTSRGESTNVRTYAVKRKSQGVKKEGIKKKVKVPKKLRKQIKQVLKANDHYGWALETFAFKITPDEIGQDVFSLGQPIAGTRLMFDPIYVAHIASVLFNQKAITASPGLSDTGYFPLKSLKVNVHKQTSTFRFRNNTARTMYIKLYEVSPKNRGDDTDGTNFDQYWYDCMDNENNSGGVGNPAKLNVSGATPEVLYCTPYMIPSVTANWAIDQTTVVLEPGKEYTYSMSGKNSEYNFKKFYRPNDNFLNEQKFTKQLCIAVHYDMVSTSLGVPTRKTEMLGVSPYGLLVEQTKYIKLSMPEQTGISFPTAITPGNNYPATNRKNGPYVINNWYASGDIGNIAVVNDETPNIPAAAGI